MAANSIDRLMGLTRTLIGNLSYPDLRGGTSIAFGFPIHNFRLVLRNIEVRLSARGPSPVVQPA